MRVNLGKSVSFLKGFVHLLNHMGKIQKRIKECEKQNKKKKKKRKAKVESRRDSDE